MMKTKSFIAASTLALAMASGSAFALEKGVSVSGDAGSHDAWSSTVQINGHYNSVSLNQYAVGGDSVKTIDYKHQLTNFGSPLRVMIGLSGMKSDYSDYKVGEKDYEAGYALGVHVGFGYDIFSTGTSFDIGLTEEVAESRFRDGKILDVGITQKFAKGFAVKAGFRQIDREVDGQSDELLETGYLGFKFSF